MGEKSCKTCRWWKREQAGSFLGECSVPLDPEPLLLVSRLRTEAASCPELWEPKKEEKP